MTKKNRDRRVFNRFMKRTFKGKRPAHLNRRRGLIAWYESRKYYGWITGDVVDSPFSNVPDLDPVSFKLSLPNPFTEV